MTYQKEGSRGAEGPHVMKECKYQSQLVGPFGIGVRTEIISQDVLLSGFQPSSRSSTKAA